MPPIPSPHPDKVSAAACLAIRTQVGLPSPLAERLSPQLPLSTSSPTRLTDRYANAYSDFYGSNTPCIFKSGPKWPIRTGFEAQGIVREARPIYRHAIGPTWLSIGTSIYQGLDSMGVMWTSINPLAYANEGEARPFCALVLSIGVKPLSLLYDDAVAAAEVVKKILANAGFLDIEVAFVESVVTRSVAAVPSTTSPACESPSPPPLVFPSHPSRSRDRWCDRW